jgi:hypothetical protein
MQALEIEDFEIYKPLPTSIFLFFRWQWQAIEDHQRDHPSILQ